MDFKKFRWNINGNALCNDGWKYRKYKVGYIYTFFDNEIKDKRIKDSF